MLAQGPGWPPPDGAEPDLPLGGVRVLDLSRVLAGPYATMVLADLGADVVKVERPGTGDDTRHWGPPFLGADAAYFLAVNRGRRSLVLDLADPRGAAIVARLAGAADVVVENFLPRHLSSLRLDAVRDANPQAVWVSVRGAGGDGPSGGMPGYDVMVQARSGLMGVTGFPETGPTKVGVAIADVVTGLYAAVAALAGLLQRTRAGPSPRGPRLEVGLLEAAVSALVNQAANHLIGHVVPRPMGNDHPNIAPYGPLECADRALVVGAGNDRQFRALCQAIDAAELAGDRRFATNAGRVANRSALGALLGEVFARRSADEWQRLLEAAGVPCAPVNAMDDVFADAHLRAVGAVDVVPHPAGRLPQVRSPLRVDGHRLPVRRPPPLLGEHTDEILHGLGLDATTITGLRDRGVC
jgi:crotonobetainyl-CoA:carnitine CoA-transferase CaiB-like acyl-CoA transferase